MTAEKQAAAEAIIYQMIDKNADCYDIEPRVAEIIHEGFKRIIGRESIKEFIRAVNIEIVNNCGTNIDITGALGDVYVRETKGAYINNVERLKVVLGEHFRTLVIDDEIATQDLIDIACDADDPRAPEVRGCITIKNIVNATWAVRG